MENKQTAIQQMIDFINDINDNDSSEFNYYYDPIIGKLNELLEVEKEQLENARPQIVSNCVIKEISDDDIEKVTCEHSTNYSSGRTYPEIRHLSYANGFLEGIKWYREQLKNNK